MDEARSQEISEANEEKEPSVGWDTSAIDDFKELKTMKKKHKMESVAKKNNRSEASTVTNLAKLVLARQKLLK